ncbi:NOZZLE domain-containing protein [Cephalotus follicularis]|uniref:NOZZLE domain-containing protein n=1 Tax=Cephalotus follicularis TaxID=3775 RepID=A0A1Q3C2F7_CEPFO|nr:NOZZLE domain-containing protein [Cephalotus follicularis]
MATPFLFMLNGQNPTRQEQPRTHHGSLETEPLPSNNRGRKPGKVKKKQPQRGMGVAQLERLRLQERWKKMTEISDPLQYQPLPGPIASAGNYNGSMVGGSGLVGFDQALVIQRMGNGGFGGGSGQVMMDPNWIGASHDLRIRVGTSVLGTSKELSSMPKNMMQQCVSERCDVCFKGVEAVAIHRKGNSSMGGSMLVEYEFFPGKSGRGTSNEELIKLPREASVAVGGEASYITTTAYSANPSNSVDLSLKLSY